MRNTAFLFPGQGSQKVGMGQALCAQFPAAREVFGQADEALGFSLSKLCFEGPEDSLTLTANAQPAILTTSLAALAVLEQETDRRAAVAAGHSLGEYSALCAAGAIRLADAVRVVHLRGKFMQDAVAPGVGAMAALLGLEKDAVDELCRDATLASGGVVSAANLNGGGQIVIAGAAAAVDKACELAKARGAKRAIPLKVSAPFHCALMQPAADRLAQELAKISIAVPSYPVISNVEAVPNTEAGRVRDLLVRQVTAPVRWQESIEALAGLGITHAIEIGAGNVLAGLVKRIAPNIAVLGAADPESIAKLASSQGEPT